MRWHLLDLGGFIRLLPRQFRFQFAGRLFADFPMHNELLLSWRYCPRTTTCGHEAETAGLLDEPHLPENLAPCQRDATHFQVTFTPSESWSDGAGKRALERRGVLDGTTRQATPVPGYQRSGGRRDVWNTRRISTVSPRTR